MNIVKAMLDRKVLGFAFHSESWNVWRTILAGAFGLQLSAADTETFRRLTQREPLSKAARELWVIAGRRAGKTNVAAAIAVYLAALKQWTVSPGETPTIMVLAADRDQARVAFRYALGLLESSPILKGEIAGTTSDTIRLENGVEIVIATSDKAAVRGRTLIAVICDEVSFWGSEADEVLRAVRPGMATQPAAMLIAISTAYSQRGPLYEAYRRFYGVADPRVLVVRASTRDLNSNITAEFVDAELARDPQAAAAEYLAEFRSDLAALLDAQLVDSCTRSEPRELPFRKVFASGNPISYVAGLDVSGGRADATAATVLHKDGERVVVDACRHWPAPHDPAQVAREVAAFLHGYNVRSAVADQYGAELTRSIYAEAGLTLIASELNRSESYLALQPQFTTGRIEIPDDPRLRAELLGLERRTGKSGKDAVDHRVGQHDDLSNSLAVGAWPLIKRTVSTGDQVFAVFTNVNAGLAGLGGSDDMKPFDDHALSSRDVTGLLADFLQRRQ